MTVYTYLAPYACDPQKSKGRVVQEEDSIGRSVYQRDRDRILHSTAFRRLKYKTQVFVNHEGDHYRTRLTHSLEVAQIARTFARSLGLNEDLAEALALGHDLGHPPFGHAGEDALDEVMQPYGGFNHNDQTFRVITKLEKKYAAFDGLNLTWETLEGIVKHNGPLAGREKPIPPTIAAFNENLDLELRTHASAEAQVAAIADDVAYNCHDIDDGLRAGLFEVEDLYKLPIVGDVFIEIRNKYPTIDQARWVYESLRKLTHLMVMDVLEETKKRLDIADPKNVDVIRYLGHPVVAFSPLMNECDHTIKAFLKERMYEHYHLQRRALKTKRLLQELFETFITEPKCLPPEWVIFTDYPKSFKTARIVADYMAGMTDRYAIQEHQRLFNLYG
jgi:dGTPase